MASVTVILSRALLPAADSAITVPTITRRIRGGPVNACLCAAPREPW
ncbi:hypothetical protein HD595_005874 [Nonomuraea roseoviolacea subsp. carminata]|uniref:Uncharacterized protein n=1 Tax=Nonomuraea roseoviolacea subsp. carminata TaxID=160689 RepID=A0ABT1K7S3_9ACTN|nr:hypothetical protein [Nonomuraea roseoviolacea subsp. carminata]